jgi:RNA recognition motif-containing protein
VTNVFRREPAFFDQRTATEGMLRSIWLGLQRARVVRDRESRHSRGFGFVDMPDELGARAAIADLNGRDWYGRVLTVREACAEPPSRSGPGPRREQVQDAR